MNQFEEQAEIVRQEQLTPEIFRLSLKAPEIASQARPGQFVMVQTASCYDPLLRRPLSIHQTIGNELVQLLYKVVGKGTRMLAALTPGQRLKLTGPLGHGFDFSDQQALCLVGGGMGIAPLYFLAKEILRTANPPKCVVLLGARTAAEFGPLPRDFMDIGVTQTHLATDDGSLGHQGFVAELLLQHLAPGNQWSVCTCGPHPMMKAVVKACRQQEWQCQVSLETMMACGISACLGCAIPRADLSGPYLHVCKDGPVFNANEVAWL
ncbi:dihydroorotate dehydrogenase electron transfer subunit [Thiovibrio frasassiensis]|uniref:Dihydroorotate dehydrogenase B (NAD(+)), electron transfer subunit n=1 Tax=Thiovibrio frasassiensis TaxID=2984131 RepID=A0A9X4MFH0_9BACT|nr:dihydroorotate dehydrogenase electron transfer subunit [Thiovibrio frasassiensis]MDG4475677.1 dihydroorotate dehydrogenase electron transfer subunit [Thiovibrio frasassiensis]